MGHSSSNFPRLKDLFLAPVRTSHTMMFWGSLGSSTVLLNVTRYLGKCTSHTQLFKELMTVSKTGKGHHTKKKFLPLSSKAEYHPTLGKLPVHLATDATLIKEDLECDHHTKKKFLPLSSKAEYHPTLGKLPVHLATDATLIKEDLECDKVYSITQPPPLTWREVYQLDVELFESAYSLKLWSPPKCHPRLVEGSQVRALRRPAQVRLSPTLGCV